WNGIAGFCYDVLGVLEGLDIVRVVFLDHPRVLHIRSVIDERADLHTIGELRRTADMVAMIVRNHHIVELLDFSGLSGLYDPLGIAPIEAAETGVDQHRLAGGAHY